MKPNPLAGPGRVLRVALPLAALPLLMLTLAAGCSGLAPAASVHTPQVLARYDFSYQFPRTGAIGLIQVFDDGLSTYLQLPAGGGKDVVIRSEAGEAPLDVRQSGPLLVIAGVHPRLVLSAGGRTLEILHPQPAITTGAQPLGP